MMNNLLDGEQKRDQRNFLLHLVRHGQNSILDDFLTDMKTRGTPCDLTITNSAGESLIGIAVEYNRLSTVKILLRHGAPHEQPNRTTGLIPIVSAQANKNEEMIYILENPEEFLSEHHEKQSPGLHK